MLGSGKLKVDGGKIQIFHLMKIDFDVFRHRDREWTTSSSSSSLIKKIFSDSIKYWFVTFSAWWKLQHRHTSKPSAGENLQFSRSQTTTLKLLWVFRTLRVGKFTLKQWGNGRKVMDFGGMWLCIKRCALKRFFCHSITNFSLALKDWV